MVSFDVELVELDSLGIGVGELVHSRGGPGRLDDSAAMFARAAVTAVLLRREVEESRAPADNLSARNVLELFGESAVPVVVSVLSVDSEGLLRPGIPPLSFGSVGAPQWELELLCEVGRPLVRPRRRDWFLARDRNRKSS